MLCKAEQIHKITIIFTQNDIFVHAGQFWVTFFEFAQLITFSATNKWRNLGANWSKLDPLFTCKVAMTYLVLNPNKILILGKVGFQSDQITAASWSGNNCQPSNQLIITLIRLLFATDQQKVWFFSLLLTILFVYFKNCDRWCRGCRMYQI